MAEKLVHFYSYDIYFYLLITLSVINGRMAFFLDLLINIWEVMKQFCLIYFHNGSAFCDENFK